LRAILALIFVSLSLSACVSVEVQPKHLVSETVDAGKDLYRTVRAKSTGMEERSYSYTVPSDSSQMDTEAVEECFSNLTHLANSTSKKEASIYDQQSEVITVEGRRSVRCSVTALIKPNN
jgi:hypothetical protein